MNNQKKIFFKIKKIIVYYFFIIVCLLISGGKMPDPVNSKADKDFMQIIENIAKDIEVLKVKYPQLKNFEISKNLNKESCKIQYEYKCHESTQKAGWISLVPNPDPDGIWFYICIWDDKDPVESTSQMNTQRASLPLYLKNRHLTYHILEGKKTKSVNDEIYKILKKHGLKETK